MSGRAWVANFSVESRRIRTKICHSVVTVLEKRDLDASGIILDTMKEVVDVERFEGKLSEGMIVV